MDGIVHSLVILRMLFCYGNDNEMWLTYFFVNNINGIILPWKMQNIVNKTVRNVFSSTFDKFLRR